VQTRAKIHVNEAAIQHTRGSRLLACHQSCQVISRSLFGYRHGFGMVDMCKLKGYHAAGYHAAGCHAAGFRSVRLQLRHVDGICQAWYQQADTKEVILYLDGNTSS
jgi:hypothetical protein